MKLYNMKIEYKGYKIFFTAGYYVVLGSLFKTLKKAKSAIDNTINQKEKGIW